LDATLTGAPHELNELDWKQDLSPNKRRCVEHLSAFANQPGGGFFAFGINDAGVALGVGALDIDRITGMLTNLGRSALDPPIFLDHAVEEFLGKPILFIYVHESPVKPVALRGESMENTFIRTGGSTRRASRQEVGMLLVHSRTPRWEELDASVLWEDMRILSDLDLGGIAGLLSRPRPNGEEASLVFLEEQGLINRDPRGGAHVTNLGAIAAAHRLSDFPDISRKAVRVIVYDGNTRQQARHEQEGRKGYAISFDGLMTFVTSQLPQSEVIDKAFRQKMPMYPEVALREIIANALIHQDFSVAGTGPLVEIFGDRIEISNPGGLLPSKRADRLFSTPSESRNERLARAFRLYGICEERGSGLFRAGRAIELYGLPPVKFDAGSNYFKVTLYSPRTYAQMSVSERLQACYQHAVIQFVAGEFMTNKSLRERLRMPEARRSMVSALIQQALDGGLIKPADPDNRSKKFMQYLPIWA
jgi:predicted HTH transcriptional regulator